MRREWEPEELIAAWTLLDGDWELVGNKTGATRLGFGVLLKFFEQEGRFPRHAGEVPKAAVDYVAGQVKVDPALFAEYRWAGSTIEYHRAQVREALGFRESTRADEDVLAAWLADKICPMVFTDEGLRAALLARCRTLKIEPPGRVERIAGAGSARFEREFCLHVLNRLSADSARSLWELATGEDGFLQELKSDPGRLGLETLLEEIRKLRRAKTLGLSADLFGGYSDRLVASWRARAMASHPSDFAANPPAIRLTLMAALAWSRTTEITDALVDLFIGLVSKINTRAERKVERAIEAEAKKVHRKTEKLFSIAEASLRRPEGTVRQVVFPAVPGGEATLKALVAEAKADAKTFKAQVRTVLTSSYSSYYWRMLPKLLAAIEFKCNNTAYRPVMDALDLLQRYADIPNRPGTTTPRRTSPSRAWFRTAGWKRSALWGVEVPTVADRLRELSRHHDFVHSGTGTLHRDVRDAIRTFLLIPKHRATVTDINARAVDYLRQHLNDLPHTTLEAQLTDATWRTATAALLWHTCWINPPTGPFCCTTSTPPPGFFSPPTPACSSTSPPTSPPTCPKPIRASSPTSTS